MEKKIKVNEMISFAELFVALCAQGDKEGANAYFYDAWDVFGRQLTTEICYASEGEIKGSLRPAIEAAERRYRRNTK